MSGFHAALRDRIAKSNGGETQLREMANIFDMTYGLYMSPRYLALQYLIGIDVIPLGRTMTLVGPPGSGKSVFGWFLSTLFAESQGFIGFVDAENKTSWDQVAGVYRAKGLNAKDWFWRLHPTEQQQMFEHTMTHGQELTKTITPRFEGKTKTKSSLYGAPLMYFVDSISYLASAAQVEKRVVKNEQGSSVGFAGAHKANNLSEHLSTFTPNYVDSWPALYVAINHQKAGLDEGGGGYGGPKKSEPGGALKDFMYSLNIEFAKANSIGKHIVGVKRQGMTLRTQKSCFADHGRQIGLLMCTTQEGDGISVNFEWGRALVDLLATGTKGWGGADKACPANSAILGDVLDMTRESQSKCSSKAMGLSGVSPEEMGEAIFHKCEQDDAFYAVVQQALWITRKRVHKPADWHPPVSKGKMAIDAARELMPLEGDKAGKKKAVKKASPRKAVPKAPAAPVASEPVAEVVAAPVVAAPVNAVPALPTPGLVSDPKVPEAPRRRSRSVPPAPTAS
jgi:ABC-type oligopeptide transport system ATPase subunit